MSADPTSQATAPAGPAIHEAERVPGGVRRWAALTETEAVARRRLGLDIVVCGDDTMQNCDLAGRIEGQVGPSKHQGPHPSGGLYALPHWQQTTRPPTGHSFYETHVTKSLPPP